MSRLSPRTPRAARGWWPGAPTGGGPVCYRTKRSALRAFLDANQTTIDAWGGLARGSADRRRMRQGGRCPEFDPVNAKLGLQGRHKVCLLDDAIWASLREGKPRHWCLDKIDLAALNEVGRNIHGGKGPRLVLPGEAEEAIASRRWEEYSQGLECGDASREGVRACRKGSRAFRLRAGVDAKSGKRRRGARLQADYACERDSRGRFVACRAREEAPF